jgi:7-keto-8-aminopelargonate synthetase-like enzyme
MLVEADLFGGQIAARYGLTDSPGLSSLAAATRGGFAPEVVGKVAAAAAALTLVRREPWRREKLQANAARLRARLDAHGIDTRPSVTHIVPVVIGANDAAMSACERLLERGFYAQGIRHPSVAEGTARLRITPMATHGEDEIDALADAVAEEVARVS